MTKTVDDIIVLGRLLNFLWTFAFFKQPKKSIAPDVQPIQEVIGEKKLQKLINFALRYMSKIVLPVKRGNFVEFRNGTINLSPIGQSCTQEERQGFVVFDAEHGIRKKFVKQLRRKFGSYGLEFAIEDQISVKVASVRNINQFVFANKQDLEDIDQPLTPTYVSETESISSMSSSDCSSTDSTDHSSSPEIVKTPEISEIEHSCRPKRRNFIKDKDDIYNTALIMNDSFDGDITFHINKDMLARHSPVFNSLFFDDPNNIGKNKFKLELEDDYPDWADFHIFLGVLHDDMDLEGWRYMHFHAMIIIAKQFECEYVIKKICSFFLTLPQYDMRYDEILELAEYHSLTKFMDEYLKKLEIDQLEDVRDIYRNSHRVCETDLSDETREKAARELEKRERRERRERRKERRERR